VCEFVHVLAILNERGFTRDGRAPVHLQCQAHTNRFSIPHIYRSPLLNTKDIPSIIMIRFRGQIKIRIKTEHG